MKKRYWWLGSLATIVVIFCLVPLLLLAPIINGLLPQYSPWQGRLEAASFNVFTGTVRIESLALENSDGHIRVGSAEVELDYRYLIDKKIMLNQVRLYDAHINVALQDTINMGGFVIERDTSNATIDTSTTTDNDAKAVSSTQWSWGMGATTVDVKAVKIDYTSPQLTHTIMVNHITVSDIESWQPELQSPMSCDIVMGESGLSIKGESQIFLQPPQLDMEVKATNLRFGLINGFLHELGITLTGELNSHLNIKIVAVQPQVFEFDVQGPLTLTDFTAQLPDEQVVQVKDLTLDLKHHLNLDDLTFMDQSELTVIDLGFKQPGMHSALSAKYSGQTQGVFSPLNIQSKYDLQAHTLSAFSVFPKPVQVSLGKASFQGEAMVSQADVFTLDQRANIILDDFAFEAHKSESEPITLAGFKQLSFNTLVVNVPENTFTTPAIVLTDVYAIGKGMEQADMTFKQLSLDNVDLTLDAVKIDTVQLQTLDVEFILHEAGNNLTAWLAHFMDSPVDTEKTMAEPNANAPNESEPAVAKPFGIQINNVILDQGNKIAVSQAGERALIVEDIDVHMNTISNIDPAQKSTFTLSSTVNYTGSVKGKGSVQPFSAAKNLNSEFQIKNLDLVKLNPIVQASSGYTIKRGALNLDNVTLLQGDTLNAINAVELIKLSISNYEGKGVDRSASAIGMSPNVAVTLLKGSDGNIQLDLPIDGDINDPSFNIGGVISQSIFKALKETLLLVFKIDFKGDKIKFNPVKFALNEISLDSDAQQALDDIAGTLKAYPDLSFVVCAFAQSEERQASFSVDAIALERQKAVLTYLIEHKGVNKKQLASCAPTIGLREKPSVEISM